MLRTTGFERPCAFKRALPASVLSQSSGLPRRPVIVPAGRIDPEPPGSGSDEPPPAGTALAPSSRGHRLPSFGDQCIRNEDECQGKVAEAVTPINTRHAARSASALPTGFSETIENVGVLFWPKPGRAFADLKVEGVRRNRNGLCQRRLRFRSPPKFAQCGRCSAAVRSGSLTHAAYGTSAWQRKT
jgi:hypothetical protein